MQLTERAVAKAVKLAEKDGVPKVMRVGVKGGGCSGLSYFMDFEPAPRDGDQIFEYGDLKVICDPKSLPFLADTELDYETSLLKAGFRFNNHLAKRSCSCGESFSV